MQPDSLSERLHHLPRGFDPCAQPILARHWFGIGGEIEISNHVIEAECIDQEAA